MMMTLKKTKVDKSFYFLLHLFVYFLFKRNIMEVRRKVKDFKMNDFKGTTHPFLVP